MEHRKISITWLTGSCFFDVDAPLIPVLQKYYDIHWVIIYHKDSYFSEEDMYQHIRINNINGKIYKLPKRMRSYSSFQVYREFINYAKKLKTDLYYINFIGIPYLWPLIFLSSIPQKKVIYPCHDFKDHLNVKNRRLYQLTKKFIFKTFKNFQFFSQTQLKLFSQEYHNKKTFYAPLTLKDFGSPTSKTSPLKTTFLFFGNIRENKGLEILIQASNLLYEKYGNKFVIKICGNCNNWDFYKKYIQYYECLDLQIQNIPNEDIPNLFQSTSYLILPYKDVTQSGPLLIAYNYNIPVIASNHDGFKEYIKHQFNGFIFENNNSYSLFQVMSDILDDKYNYSTIYNNLSTFIKENVSFDSIIKKYIEGFNQIISSYGK